jgi:hypothetical protein
LLLCTAGDPNYFQDEIKGVSASGGVASVPIMRGGYYWVDQNVNPAAAAGVGIGVAAVVGGVAFVVWKLRSNFHCTCPLLAFCFSVVSRVHCAVLALYASFSVALRVLILCRPLLFARCADGGKKSHLMDGTATADSSRL